MLVLSRKVNETVCIGEDVQLTILSIRGDRVRVGISAPRDVPVHRFEIYELINNLKKEEAEGRSHSTKAQEKES